MPLWRKQPWPDDPPKGNGTTIKGIETFGDKGKKAYNDSLKLYNLSHYSYPEELTKRKFIKFRDNADQNSTIQDINSSGWKKPYQILIGSEYEKKMWQTNNSLVNLMNKSKIKPIGYYDSHIDNIVFKKPTGNGLKPQLSKVPIIQPEQTSSYIKFRPPTTLPQGNVELQNTGYTTIGIKKKPDGTRFIYDRSGKTDKTVIIDDNRIGFEHYIKKLYE